jgi:transcriptional regulator with XRE-family HTH domain
MNDYVSLIMQDQEIRKSVGTRIKQLRKQRGWTQKELAKHLEGSYQQLNKYESGIHAPPLDKLVQLADALNTTIDYLITGQTPDETPLHNKRLLQKFKLLEGFDANQQETVINVIDAMVAKHQMEETLKTLGTNN